MKNLSQNRVELQSVRPYRIGAVVNMHGALWTVIDSNKTVKATKYTVTLEKREVSK